MSNKKFEFYLMSNGKLWKEFSLGSVMVLSISECRVGEGQVSRVLDQAEAGVPGADMEVGKASPAETLTSLPFYRELGC